MGGWIGQARALTYIDEAIGAAPPSIEVAAEEKRSRSKVSIQVS
jgi:hypothetical protein